MIRFVACPNDSSVQPIAPRGLPARIYVPILVVFAVALLAIVGYFVAVGYSVGGSVLGNGKTGTAASQNGTNRVEGGPPPAVMAQLQTLRARIVAHPKDDVALTQLGDMYLAANRFAQAIPLYERALRANPGNVAAKAGLAEAKSALNQ